jgi:hypothetical protein
MILTPEVEPQRTALMPCSAKENMVMTMSEEERRSLPIESMPCWSDKTDLVYLGRVVEIPLRFMGTSRADYSQMPDFYEKRVEPNYTLTHDATLPVQKIEALVPGEDKVVILWRVPYRRVMNVKTRAEQSPTP